MLFLPLSSQSIFWTLSALLAIVANVSFGASIVALNSYLPGLAKGSEPVAEAWNEAERIRLENPNSDALAELDIPEEPPEYTDDLTPLTRAPSLPEPYRLALKHYNDVLSRTTSHISSLGIALGYSAGITLLIIILVPVTLLKGSTYSLRLALFMTGAWWALFTIPSSAWLPGGEALQKQSISNDDGDDWSVKREILRAWKRLGQMLFPSEIKKLRNTFWFLAAWFLLSDGKGTERLRCIILALT
jgi:UMF1 family MFS transporter